MRPSRTDTRDTPGSGRRFVRRIAKIFVALLVLVMVLAVAALAVFYSDFGQDRMRRYAERALSLDGYRQIAIGDLSVGLSGTIAARGVTIRDAQGKDVITVASVEADLQLLPLLDRQVIIDSIAAEKGAVRLAIAEDGAIDLRNLAPPHDPARPAPHVKITGISLTDITLTAERAGWNAPVEIAIDEMSGSLELGTSTRKITVDQTRLRWDAHEVTARTAGTIDLETGRVGLRDVAIEAHGSRLASSAIDLPSESGAISTTVTGVLARSDMPWLCLQFAELVPGQAAKCHAIEHALSADLIIESLTIAYERPRQLLHVQAAMASGGTELHADAALATGDRYVLDGTFAVRGFLAKDWFITGRLPDLLAAPLELQIEARQVTGTDLASIRGNLAITARTHNQRFGDLSLALDVTAREGQAIIAVTTPLPGDRSGEPLAEITGRATIDHANRPVRIERAELTGRIPSLASLGGPLSGRAEDFRLELRGPLDGLHIAGTARLASLVHPGAGSIERADVGFTASNVSLTEIAHPGRAMHGQVRLAVHGVQRDRYRVGSLTGRITFDLQGGGVTSVGRQRPIRLVARSSAAASDVAIPAGRGVLAIASASTESSVLTWQPGKWQIALGTYQIDSHDLTWRGDGGRITSSPRQGITIEHLVATSRTGQVSVEGNIAPERRSMNLTVGATALDLATIAALRGVTVTGQASGTVHIDRDRDGWKVSADTQLAQLVWRADAPPIDGTLQVDYTRDRLLVAGTVREPASQSELSFTTEMQPPASPLDAAGWTELRLDATRRIRLASSGVELTALYALAGLDRSIAKESVPSPSPPAGRVAGTIDLTNDGQPRIAFAISAPGITVKPDQRTDRDLDVSISGEWQPTGMTAKATLGHRGQALFSGQGSLAVALPARWRFLATGLVADIMRAPLRVSLRADQLDVARVLDTGWIDLPHTPASESSSLGRISGKIDITGSVGDPLFEVREMVLSDVDMLGLAFERITISGQASRAGVAGKITARHQANGTLLVAGSYQTDPVPSIDVDIKLRSIDLSFARAFAWGSPDLLAAISGLVDAHLRVRGDPAGPSVAGQVALRRGALWLGGGRRHVHDVSASLDIATDHVLVRELTGYIDRGRVQARGRLELADGIPGQFRGRVTTTGFAIPLSEYSAEISATADVTGGYESGVLDARFAITPGAQVVIQELGRRLQSIAPLEDVIYVARPASSDRGATRRTRDASSPHRGPVHTIRLHIATAGRNRSNRPPGIAVRFNEITARARPAPEIGVEFVDWQLYKVTGKIETLAGEATIFDRQYTIESGQLAWDGRSFIPSMAMRLAGELPSATVSVNVSGSLLTPDIALESDRSADETTVLAIMNGADPDDPESIAYATVSGGSKFIGDLQKHLPEAVRLDVVRVFPDGFAVGKRVPWLSRNILLSYRYRSEPEAKENQNEAMLRWQLPHDVVLEAQYGDSDLGGADLLWRIRF